MEVVKKLIKHILVAVVNLFYPQKAIIFESVPDFSDNTYPVFQEMVRRKIGMRYVMVWACTDKMQLNKVPDNIICIYPECKSLKERLRYAYYMASAMCLISCNHIVLPWHEKQLAFYLSHGTPMKYVRSYYVIPESVDYCLSASPDVEELMAYQFMIPREKVVSLGFPRNDILTRQCQSARELIGTACQKVIAWYPTFRKHNSGFTAGSGKALPIIHDVAAAVELNEWAKEKKVMLVLKPHFAQDLSQIKDLGLSNILFIGDDFFGKYGTTSYGFIAGCDALITDYSSIYYDYMLCDKPVRLIWEDIEEYRANPGFAVDLDEFGKGGVKIYTLEDLKQFLSDVSEGKDSCQTERRALCKVVNYADDGRNAERVVDFIVEKAGL